MIADAGGLGDLSRLHGGKGEKREIKRAENSQPFYKEMKVERVVTSLFGL